MVDTETGELLSPEVSRIKRTIVLSDLQEVVNEELCAAIQLLSNGSLELFKEQFGEKIAHMELLPSTSLYALNGKVMEEVGKTINAVRKSDKPLPHQTANLMHMASKALELARDIEPPTDAIRKTREQQQRQRKETHQKMQAFSAMEGAVNSDELPEVKQARIEDILKNGIAEQEKQSEEE